MLKVRPSIRQTVTDRSKTCSLFLSIFFCPSNFFSFTYIVDVVILVLEILDVLPVQILTVLEQIIKTPSNGIK